MTQFHKTYGNGQLQPLEDRIPEKQYERRTQKMVGRLAREHAVTRGMLAGVLQVLRRGFGGRLKWAIFGR